MLLASAYDGHSESLERCHICAGNPSVTREASRSFVLDRLVALASGESCHIVHETET